MMKNLSREESENFSKNQVVEFNHVEKRALGERKKERGKKRERERLVLLMERIEIDNQRRRGRRRQQESKSGIKSREQQHVEPVSKQSGPPHLMFISWRGRRGRRGRRCVPR